MLPCAARWRIQARWPASDARCGPSPCRNMTMLLGLPGGRKSQYWLSASPNGPCSRTPVDVGGGGGGAAVVVGGGGGGGGAVVVAALFHEAPHPAAASRSAAQPHASGRGVNRIES